jgi:hypothetical protein
MVELIRGHMCGGGEEGALGALRGDVGRAMEAAARMRWTRKGLERGGHEEGEMEEESALASESDESDVARNIEEDEVLRRCALYEQKHTRSIIMIILPTL